MDSSGSSSGAGAGTTATTEAVPSVVLAAAGEAAVRTVGHALRNGENAETAAFAAGLSILRSLRALDVK